MEKEIKIRSRIITFSDIETIKEIIEREGKRGRTYISKILCEKWEWRQSNGRYREIACRDILRKLSEKGYIELPERKRKIARRAGYKNKIQEELEIDSRILECNIREIKEIEIKEVRSKTQGEEYKSIVGRYHYLGYRQSIGESIRYLIYGDGRILGCIGFSSSAWRVECRDRYLGIEDKTREEKIRRIKCNDRFLILPCVRIKNLASYILSRVMSRIGRDWEEKYSNKIEIVETYVDSEKFRGICYKASNWKYVGETVGRGRNDRKKEKKLSKKGVYLYELERGRSWRKRDE